MPDLIFTTAQLLLLGLQAGLTAIAGYLLLLTVAAWRAPRTTPLAVAPPDNRFLILIPAHNEARLLPQLLANLSQLDYPKELYAVHVVADNCTDETAERAREGGAVVHERENRTLRGKGYALQWLLERLWQAGEAHDAVVILDADSLVSANFLRVMDARLVRGERVIQAYYGVRDPGRSWNVSLRYLALAVLHYLRPLGRMVLGGSAGLKGNGMVFTASLLRQRQWTASLTEDIEFHMGLLLDGERVTFAPDALVEAEMPETLEAAETQNERWEQGRLQMAVRFVPRLLHGALAPAPGERRFPLLDAAMEHLIPPFSILVALGGLSFLLSWLPAGAKHRRPRTAVHVRKLNRLLATGIVGSLLFYLLSGLRLVGAPRSVYRSLLHAPRFIIWKLWLYLRAWFGAEQDEWIRTRRN